MTAYNKSHIVEVLHYLQEDDGELGFATSAEQRQAVEGSSGRLRQQRQQQGTCTCLLQQRGQQKGRPAVTVQPPSVGSWAIVQGSGTLPIAAVQSASMAPCNGSMTTGSQEDRWPLA